MERLRNWLLERLRRPKLEGLLTVIIGRTSTLLINFLMTYYYWTDFDTVQQVLWEYTVSILHKSEFCFKFVTCTGWTKSGYIFITAVWSAMQLLCNYASTMQFERGLTRGKLTKLGPIFTVCQSVLCSRYLKWLLSLETVSIVFLKIHYDH